MLRSWKVCAFFFALACTIAACLPSLPMENAEDPDAESNRTRTPPTLCLARLIVIPSYAPCPRWIGSDADLSTLLFRNGDDQDVDLQLNARTGDSLRKGYGGSYGGYGHSSYGGYGDSSYGGYGGSSSSRPSGCSDSCPTSYLHDGACDWPCNNAACNYDNGDCPRPTPAPTPPTIAPTRFPTRANYEVKTSGTCRHPIKTMSDCKAAVRWAQSVKNELWSSEVSECSQRPCPFPFSQSNHSSHVFQGCYMHHMPGFRKRTGWQYAYFDNSNSTKDTTRCSSRVTCICRLSETFSPTRAPRLRPCAREETEELQESAAQEDRAEPRRNRYPML